MISTLDYRGIPATIVYRWLPERQVCLIVKMDQSEAFAPVAAFGRTLIAARRRAGAGRGDAAGLRAGAGHYRAGARPGCWRPQEIGRGRSGAPDRCEIERRTRQALAATFNDMAAKLRHSRQRAGSRQQGTGGLLLFRLARPARAAAGDRRLLTHPARRLRGRPCRRRPAATWIWCAATRSKWASWWTTCWPSRA